MAYMQASMAGRNINEAPDLQAILYKVSIGQANTMYKPWLRHTQLAQQQADAQISPGRLQNHPNLRRLTPRYQRKKRLVRNIWLVSLLIMIPFSLGAKLALALGTTFLGLIILDETK